MKKSNLSIFCISIFLMLLSLSGLAQDNSWQKMYAKSNEADVLIKLKNQADLSQVYKIENRIERLQFVYNKLRETSESSQSQIIDFLKSRNKKFQSFYILNLISVDRLTFAEAQELSSFSEVKSLSENIFFNSVEGSEPFSPLENVSKAVTNIPDSSKFIGVDRVWSELGVKGKGIVIAGQDTGYAWQHPAIKKQYRGSGSTFFSHDYNWHDAIKNKTINIKAASSILANSCGYKLSEPCDDRGHGTHTMGTMVGDDGGTNKIGIAPESKWMGCRNMDEGDGKASTYLECFEFFLAPYPYGGNPRTDGRVEYAPHIINNSWGCPPNEGCKGGEFLDAIKVVQAAGIYVVASAGNNGPECSTVMDGPAFHSDVIMTVGALNFKTGKVADFSSRGPSTFNKGLGPVLMAPGEDIRSSVPGSASNPNAYGVKSGTSMSSPHMAGVVALLWSARPEFIGKIKETTDHLIKTAKPQKATQSCPGFPGDQIPNAVYGFGTVDAYSAIKTP
jgi:serine protease AprX